MRSRLTLALLGVSLAATDLAAQRVGAALPPGRRTTPERPAEKPPLMPGIHDVRSYNRYRLSRFSLDQYPMLSYVSATGMIAAGIPNDYMAFGDGTQIAFRAAPSLFITTDFTSSFYGGPSTIGTTEFGARFKPWAERRVTPFIDARLAYVYTTSSSGGGISSAAVPIVLVARSMYGDFTSGSGKGAVAGLGAETRLSARIWLTATLTHTQNWMVAKDASFDTHPYRMQATRLGVGGRFNPGRWLDAPE